MYRIEMIQAGHGDCIWIEYGENENSMHRVLIDGGTAGTYEKIKQRIKALDVPNAKFDLLVITHIDADHIAGILKLFEDEELNISFDDIWFNGYKHLLGRETLGAKQGEVLTNHLTKQGVNWNKAFLNKAACVDDSWNFTSISLTGGMQLTLLSPTKKELSELQPKWNNAAKKAGIDPENRLEELEDLITRPSGREALGSTLPDVDALASKETILDSSEANGSSIAFIAEYEEKRVLFSGDAHSTVLLDVLGRYIPNGGKLVLDAFKVPHHGSCANITRDLLSLLECSKFLVSTNGAYFSHPDEIAMSRIIKYGGEQPDLYFNYLSKYNYVWTKQELKDKHKYKAYYPKNRDTGILIEL